MSPYRFRSLFQIPQKSPNWPLSSFTPPLVAWPYLFLTWAWPLLGPKVNPPLSNRFCHYQTEFPQVSWKALCSGSFGNSSCPLPLHLGGTQWCWHNKDSGKPNRKAPAFHRFVWPWKAFLHITLWISHTWHRQIQQLTQRCCPTEHQDAGHEHTDWILLPRPSYLCSFIETPALFCPWLYSYTSGPDN